MFLAWHSNDTLAAALPAGVVSWTLASLPLGVASYGSTFVAQYFGAERIDRIGAIVWQAIWLGIISIPIFLVIGIFGKPLFASFGHTDLLVQLEADYFLALSFGSGALILDSGIGGFFIGRGKTVIVMVVNIAGACLNLFLDYIFIFGWGPIPELGIWGAGLATTISIWCKVAILAALFLSSHNDAFKTRSSHRLDWPLMKQFLSFGIPNGIQYFVEGLAITFFVIIIARVSEPAAAASSIVFSINMLVFYPVIGLGISCSTLVGQKIGEQSPTLARRVAWNTFAIGSVYTLLFAIVCFSAPDLFLVAHRLESENFDQIESMTILFLRFVAIYCMFDTVQIVFVSAIKGAGDTRFVVWSAVTSATLFLAIGLVGTHWITGAERQVYWWWVCLTGWVLLLSAIYFGRFLQGKWEQMTVLEPVAITNE